MPPVSLHVAGASNQDLATRIRGAYYPCGSLHGRVAYKRVPEEATQPAAFIYFVDDCEKPANSRWWIGGSLGRDQQWVSSVSDSTNSPCEDAPPSVGWQVVQEYEVDPVLAVQVRWTEEASLNSDRNATDTPSEQRPRLIAEASISGPTYRCTLYHNIVYLPYMKSDLLDELRENFRLQDNDVVVVSHPRCGTTWCQTIVLSMLHGPKKIRDPMKEAPWIEASFCKGRFTLADLNSSASSTSGPSRQRCLKTHAPAHLKPWTGARPGAKLLLVTRDPRDVAVSHYYHINNTSAYKFSGSWNDFNDLFLAGWIEGGDFWEWHEGWAKHAQAGPTEECLWIRYEDLIYDLRGQVERIARFLGLKDSGNLECGTLTDADLDAVAAATVFGAMSDLFSRRNIRKEQCGKKFDPHHLRNGVAGGWPEVMTHAQSDLYSARTRSCAAAVWTHSHIDQGSGQGGKF